jgi:hypothetical protein
VAFRTMTWLGDSLTCGSTDDRLVVSWPIGGRLRVGHVAVRADYAADGVLT